MRFNFATAGRILFGCGVAAELPALVRSLGARPLLVSGTRVPQLEASTRFAVHGEPTVDLVRSGVRAAREAACDVVIGFGGGSAIDAGKAIAALAANPGDVLDYLEVIGKGAALPQPPLPFVAVPTTAGTGSEVTRNAVLGSPETGVKASLRSPLMLPRIALVDPELTFDLPFGLTAATGLDALTQLIEPYVSARANAMTDLYCVEGMRLAAVALEQACREPRNREARTRMSYASLLGGLALANAGLGVVHGFAAPIGGMFHAPHGAVCAALLPHGMRANIAALRSRASDHPALARYAAIAALLTGDPAATPEQGARWVDDLCRRLDIPPLGAYGITLRHTSELASKAAAASSMKANPITLLADELTCVAEAALAR